jgi:hypothetical protein
MNKISQLRCTNIVDEFDLDSVSKTVDKRLALVTETHPLGGENAS